MIEHGGFVERESEWEIAVERVVNSLINFALVEVQRRYGAAGVEGETTKLYHNLEYTIEVVKAAELIAELALRDGRIEDGDIPIIKIAAGFHDIEQNLGAGVNEEVSAAMAAERMKESGVFGSEEVHRVVSMIRATKTSWSEEGMMQSVTGDYLTQIIADADLSSLGRVEGYKERALRLMCEISGSSNPSDEQKARFVDSQRLLLSTHEFYTEEARKLFPHQKENLKSWI